MAVPIREACAFVCLRCGHAWEGVYEIRHSADGPGPRTRGLLREQPQGSFPTDREPVQSSGACVTGGGPKLLSEREAAPCEDTDRGETRWCGRRGRCRQTCVFFRRAGLRRRLPPRPAISRWINCRGRLRSGSFCDWRSGTGGLSTPSSTARRGRARKASTCSSATPAIRLRPPAPIAAAATPPCSQSVWRRCHRRTSSQRWTNSSHSWASRSEVFIYATTHDLRPTALAEELERQADRLSKAGIRLERWGRESVSERLRHLPEIVDDFFGCSYALRRRGSPGDPNGFRIPSRWS
jgi:hypothetical protein